MAEFYGTVAEADSYHQERGNSSWYVANESDKTAALVRASEYIDGQYRDSFLGYRTGGRSQVREWPRKWSYVWNKWDWETIPDDEIPREVKRATYEAALRELDEPGFLTPDVIPAKNRKSVKVEGAVSIEYWSDQQKPVIERIDMVLAPLLNGNRVVASSLGGSVNLG